MSDADPDLDILLDVLRRSQGPGGPPEVARFRVEYEGRRRQIDALVDKGWLDKRDHYRVTLPGLRALGREGHEEARQELELVTQTLSGLKGLYRRDPGAELTLDASAEELSLTVEQMRRVASALSSLHVFATWHGEFAKFVLAERVLDLTPGDVTKESEERPEPAAMTWSLSSIAIDGYRGFRGFHAELSNPTAIIGANGTGKTSLVDALRLLRSAVQGPLPPGIEPGGRSSFRAGGPERFELEIILGSGDQRPDLRYRVGVLGPSSAPQIFAEKLSSVSKDGVEPTVYIDFSGGQGTVTEPGGPRYHWQIPPAELALRRAVDPGLWTCSSVLGSIFRWAFHPGFDTGPNAELRRSVFSSPFPTLTERGENLSAVLHWIKLHDPNAFSELETHLRGVVPGFRALGLTTPEPGKVLALWHEEGIDRPLPIGDVSDGILRFLCIAALCLSPGLPPLVCIDEPEAGLHPRALPVVADLLHRAADRAQVIVLTHSPDLLSCFELSEIAVMRREGGTLEFVRPEDSTALRRHVEEMGPAAISRLHVSDELESLP